MDLGLTGKVALVTGGSRGLGKAVCLALAGEGAHVAVNYRADQRRAAELVDLMTRTHGTEAWAIQGDVASGEDVATMFDQCEQRLSVPDILVNNAGIWPSAFVHELTEEGWDRTMAVNLKGPFLACREAVRRWRSAQRGGRVVNVSSSAAFIGSTTGHADYAASKAGLVNFTVSLARESGPVWDLCQRCGTWHDVHGYGSRCARRRTNPCTSNGFRWDVSEILTKSPR